MADERLRLIAIARQRQRERLKLGGHPPTPAPGWVPAAEQDELMEPSPAAAAFRGMGSDVAGAVAQIAGPFVSPLKKVAQALTESGIRTTRAFGVDRGGMSPVGQAAFEENLRESLPTWLNPYAEAIETQNRAAAGDPLAQAEEAKRLLYQKGGAQGLLMGAAEGGGAAMTAAFPWATAIFSAPGVGDVIHAGAGTIGDVGGGVVRAAGGGEEAQEVGRLGSKAAGILALTLLGKRLPGGAAGRVGAEVLGQAAPILGMTAGEETARLGELLGAGPGGSALAGAAGGLGGAFGGAVPVGRVLRSASRARAEDLARRGAGEQAPEVGAALEAMEGARAAEAAELAARPTAAAALAEPLGRAAERVPQPSPPPGPEAIRAQMEADAGLTRAAEALTRGKPPEQPMAPEGARYRPGDLVVWWEGEGAGTRRYGTVESVSPDRSTLKVRAPGRRTPYGVPVEQADIVTPAGDRGGQAPTPPTPPTRPVEARTVPRAPEPPAPAPAPPAQAQGAVPPPAPPPAAGMEFRPFVESRGVAWDALAKDPALLARMRTEYAASRGEPSPVDGTPPPVAEVPQEIRTSATPATAPRPETAPATIAQPIPEQGAPSVRPGGTPEAPAVPAPEKPRLSAARARAAAKKGTPPLASPTTFGANLGNVDWRSPAVRTALTKSAGGAAGYIAALAFEGEDDHPATVWARRIGFTLLGGAAAVPLWKKARMTVSRLRRPRQTPEMASEIRQNITELRAAKIDATAEGNRQILAKRVFKDPEDQFVWNEYLRDAHGSETPFLELIDRIDKGDRALANELVETAEAWRRFSSGLGDEGVAAGRVSPEVRTQRPGGHLTRIPQEKAEGSRGWFARFRKSVPKFTPEKEAHDAWGGKVTLSPEEVRAELASLGIPDPTGKRDHYLKGDESGTMLKFPPTEEGFDQASRFFDRMGELEKAASERRISASRVRGGGDPSMVVQVGKGSRADVGHLAAKAWDDVSLRLNMPRALAREVAEGIGIGVPKMEAAGRAIRAEFETAADRDAFLDGLREVAVEGATFNVTPQARRWFAQRLKGATVRVGPGSSGGATGRVIVETFGPRSKADLMTDVQDPVIRAYVTALRGGQRNAQARHLTRVAFGEDARGPWSIEVPANTKAGEVVTQGKERFVVQEDALELGDLRGPEQGPRAERPGRALREDWHDTFQSKKAVAPQEAGFWRRFVSQVKTGKVSTSAGTIFNNIQNILFHVNNGTAPWMHPVEAVKVGLRHLKAHVTGRYEPLDLERGRKVGYRLSETAVRDPEAAEAIRAIVEGAKSAEAIAAGRRGTAGRIAADVVQQGVLADVGPPGLKRTAKGLAISTGAGAATGGLEGALSDDDTGTVLWKMLRGAGYGLGFGAAARAGRKAFYGTDPFHRDFAFEVMTTKPGKWGEPLSENAARDRLNRKFQDFENMDPRIRAVSGQGSGVGEALVNEFAPAYFETLRVMKNNFADDPTLATASLLSVPAVAAILAYAAGTFGSEEERRAAKEVAPPGAFFRRDSDGSLVAFDVNRMTGADVAVDFINAVTDPSEGDSWRKILTDFGGSMIGTTIYDTGQAAFNPEARGIRYGQPLRKKGQGGPEAALETFVRGLSSPYSPEFGTTASMFRQSIEEPFKRRRKPTPSEPGMSAVRAFAGLKAEKVDFGEVRARINYEYDRAERDAEKDFNAAMLDPNVKADLRRHARARRRHREVLAAARERRDEQLRRLTPQPVGAGR